MNRPFIVLAALLCVQLAGAGSSRGRWAIYYSDRARPVEFQGYDLIVFDSDRHPGLEPILASGATVLGYLSLCEVDETRAWFGAVRDAGLLLGDQPNWPGSHLIDIRDERWRRMVVRQLTHRILAQGFAGLFLDTLDDASELERRDPQKFSGFRNAAVQLVAEIHREVPSAVLMVNRGYDVLPELLPYVNIALGESVYGTYDFSTKSYRPVATPIYRQQVELLTSLKKQKPSLRICTLDYWDPADRDGMRRVFREERAHGFDPYVTTIALDRLTKEPR
jgi:uncharacterized protein (TIGR01370 family)